MSEHKQMSDAFSRASSKQGSIFSSHKARQAQAAAAGRYVIPTNLQVKDPDLRQTELPEIRSNALAAAAYSQKSKSVFSNAKKSQAAASRGSKRPSHARSMTQSQACSRRSHVSKSSKVMERLLSPERQFFEAKLPNDDRNYSLSPAAKHALADGSLDPRQTFFGNTFNRKLRMRDTFTKIFPTYGHGEPTVAIPSHTHTSHFYPRQNDLGHPMPDIDRQHTHKKDFMKEYHEAMLKIASMRRGH